MNRKKQRFLFFPILLILLALVPSNGFASEFNFAVTPIPSEKQVDKEKTYFDLLLAPNEETELKVNLRNDTDKGRHFQQSGPDQNKCNRGVW